MDKQKEILKLAAEIACLDLQGLEDSYRNKLLILDSQIRAFRELEQAFRQRLADMDEAITNLKALYQINMRVLNLHADKPIGGREEDATDFTSRFTQ